MHEHLIAHHPEFAAVMGGLCLIAFFCVIAIGLYE